MLEQLIHFECVFNNPTIYIIECISWTIKYLILLMHGATMKICSCLPVKHVNRLLLNCSPFFSVCSIYFSDNFFFILINNLRF